MKSSPLLHLPHELLDHILSSISSPYVLLCFALASHHCAALVVPNHIQYRSLRLRTPMPSLWEHLALRADLARNIRDVRLCKRDDYTAPDCFPTTLVPPQRNHPRVWEEEVRIRNVCKALRNMTRLNVFTWAYHSDDKDRLRVNAVHEEMILMAVTEAKELEHLALGGKCAAHVVSGRGVFGMDYPIWHVSKLKSLSLVGTPWYHNSNAVHMCYLLKHSPNLEHLELPVEFLSLATIHFPHLKSLKFSLHSGGTFSSTTTRTSFLDSHPSIEYLSWFPLGPVEFSASSLPNLRALKCGRQVVEALEETDVVRKIDYLDVWSLDAEMLGRLEKVDRGSVKRIKLHMVGELDSVKALAKVFTGIQWLSMPCVYLKEGAVHPQMITLEEWLAVLPLFPSLQVFRGMGLWYAVDNCPERMHHEVIQPLVGLCPNLRQLDHFDQYNKRRDVKRIRILREEVGVGENEAEDRVEVRVRYELCKPPPWNVFDAMDGTFDD